MHPSIARRLLAERFEGDWGAPWAASARWDVDANVFVFDSPKCSVYSARTQLTDWQVAFYTVLVLIKTHKPGSF